MIRNILILLICVLCCSCLSKESDYTNNGVKEVEKVTLTITGEIGEAFSWPEVKFECFKALIGNKELCFGNNQIKGITLEKGYKYQLKVKRIIYDYPIQDGNLPDDYELISIISKQKLE